MAAASSKGLDREEKPHVLIVDGSLFHRKLNENLFTNSGCKVTAAENGQRALEILGFGDGHSPKNCNLVHRNILPNGVNSSLWPDLKVDMIITDYSMTGMTGYQLIKKIKASPTMKDIPIVVVSFVNIPTLINKCLEEGAQEFILKPLKKSDVEKLRRGMMKVGKDLHALL